MMGLTSWGPLTIMVAGRLDTGAQNLTFENASYRLKWYFKWGETAFTIEIANPIADVRQDQSRRADLVGHFRLLPVSDHFLSIRQVSKGHALNPLR